MVQDFGLGLGLLLGCLANYAKPFRNWTHDRRSPQTLHIYTIPSHITTLVSRKLASQARMGSVLTALIIKQLGTKEKLIKQKFPHCPRPFVVYLFMLNHRTAITRTRMPRHIEHHITYATRVWTNKRSQKRRTFRKRWGFSIRNL